MRESDSISAKRHAPVGVLLWIAFGLVAVTAIQAEAGSAAPTSAPRSHNDEADFVARYCTSTTKTTIPSGSEEQARRYYKDLSTKIGLEIHDPSGDEDGATT